MRILLIEDDCEICEMIKNFLLGEDIETDTAVDGEEGYIKFLNCQYELLLLDIMMPKINGLQLMQKIRESSTVPIILISARDTDYDTSMGLSLGADDYITKPFSMTELLARVKANVRRSTIYSSGLEEIKNSKLTVGDITLNIEDFSVKKLGLTIDLTSKEFTILKLFFQNPKKVYTKAQIYKQVWDDIYIGDENAVNVHISRLRKK